MKYQNITRLAIDKLLAFLASKVEWDGPLIVCQNDSVLNRASAPGVTIDSLIVKGPIPDAYTIYIRSNNGRPERIICHEFIHLMQMLRGDLVVDVQTPKFVWKGEDYEPSYPYKRRPWEKEAFARQNFWYNEYCKSIKH